ncbi:MAG: ABC transporter transmembrane domain-containing protein, partial [Pseudomonadota bacterium]
MRISYSILKPDPNIKSEDSSSEAAARGGLYRLIRERFVPHWQWFAAGTVCAAFTSIAAASYGYLLKLVVEGLERLASPEITDVPNSLWWLICVVGVAAAVRALSLYGMTMLNNTGVQRAIVDVQTVQFDALTRGDYARLAGDASGGFVSRFINDVNALREAGLRLANNLTKGVLTVVGVLITMLIMDWKLTLVLILVYPLAFGPVI